MSATAEVLPAAQSERFVKLAADGSSTLSDWVAVLDLETQLIWSRDTLPCGEVNWKKAKKACAELNLAGWTDWRLPTRKELLSLVDDTRHSPAIDTAFFNCESSWYWTSTPAAYSPGVYAWFVGFGNGYSGWDGQDGGGRVRAVRASQYSAIGGAAA